MRACVAHSTLGPMAVRHTYPSSTSHSLETCVEHVAWGVLPFHLTLLPNYI